ncbi:MAG: hypothetical protein WBQ60_04835 [Asticcacaulis sp.]
MIFLQGLWHSLKVVGVAVYWLLFIGLVWAGFAQLGSQPQWGWACFGMVLAVFAARGLIARRLVSPGASYVLGCAAFIAFFTAAWMITGYNPD